MKHMLCQTLNWCFQFSFAVDSCYVCMYVCMYRGCPSWRCPWNRAFQMGLGEGPIGIVGPVSQPRGSNDTASSTMTHTYALSCVHSVVNFTLGS